MFTVCVARTKGKHEMHHRQVSKLVYVRAKVWQVSKHASVRGRQINKPSCVPAWQAAGVCATAWQACACVLCVQQACTARKSVNGKNK